jgi:hypothetical protein
VKKTVWIAIVFMALVIGYIVVTSFRPKAFRCRVCVNFDGSEDCRTASADTQQEAVRAAVTNACAQLAGGVSDSRRCEATQPRSVEWLR